MCIWCLKCVCATRAGYDLGKRSVTLFQPGVHLRSNSTPSSDPSTRPALPQQAGTPRDPGACSSLSLLMSLNVGVRCLSSARRSDRIRLRSCQPAAAPHIPLFNPPPETPGQLSLPLPGAQGPISSASPSPEPRDQSERSGCSLHLDIFFC